MDLTAVLDQLRAGGWVIVAMVLVSLLAWLLLAMKWLRLRDEKISTKGWADGVLSGLEKGCLEEAHEALHQHSGLMSRVFGACIDQRSVHGAGLPRRIDFMIDAEARELRSQLPLVAVLSSLLPLLGLLGTVLGMLSAFAALSETDAVQVGAVADGVSQALITTQAGLLAALPVALCHNWITSRVDRSISEAHLYGRKAAAAVTSWGRV